MSKDEVKVRRESPLKVVENIEGTWDILVEGGLTHPRLTQWTKGGAEEVVRLIDEAYARVHPESKVRTGCVDGEPMMHGDLTVGTHNDLMLRCETVCPEREVAIAAAKEIVTAIASGRACTSRWGCIPQCPIEKRLPLSSLATWEVSNETIREFLKRLFCTHEYRWDQNLYGDHALHSGAGSVWECQWCGKTQYRKERHP